MIPGLLLGMYAQYKLSSAYGKYMRVPAESGLHAHTKSRRFESGLLHFGGAVAQLGQSLGSLMPAPLGTPR